jgi:hypothetical protein
LNLNLVVVEISQITESAGYVVVVVAEHIHKFEVIGNVKNCGFKTTGGTTYNFLKQMVLLIVMYT